MSSEQPIRQRRRALNTSATDIVPQTERDVFDPGPMVHYPPLPVGSDGLPQAPAVRQRIRDLRALDQRVARDFILRTLHTYLISHRPMDEIARSFGVTTRRIYQWRDELYRRIGQELKQKTPTDLVGKQIAELEKVKASAWQNFHRTDSHPSKNRYLNTIITAERSISDLYSRVGFLGPTTLTPTIDSTAEDVTGKAGALVKLATQFLESGHGKKKAEPKTFEQDITDPIDDSDYLL